MKDKNWYISNQSIFEKLASKVQSILSDILDENKIDYHIISHRCKTIESFTKKMENPKYNEGEELTDLAGIRVITYVEDTIPLISKIIEDTFTVDKENSLDKSTDLGLDRVGYKSVHFVAQLPKSRIKLAEYKKFNGLKFEIQVRTILQHSWAEIEHDRNYKFAGSLPVNIQRRFKLLAGLLELADNEFNNISREIDSYSQEVKNKAVKGELEIPINSTSLREYLYQKLTTVSENKIKRIITDGTQIVSELKSFGIQTLKDLDQIFPDDLPENYNKTHTDSSFSGVLRDLMIINDYKKYFQKSYHGDWWFDDSSGDFLILDKYGIRLGDIQKIIDEKDEQELNEEIENESEG